MVKLFRNIYRILERPIFKNGIVTYWMWVQVICGILIMLVFGRLVAWLIY